MYLHCDEGEISHAFLFPPILHHCREHGGVISSLEGIVSSSELFRVCFTLVPESRSDGVLVPGGHHGVVEDGGIVLMGP